MRALLSVAVVVSASLLACTQDSAASNAERDTHMGSVRAAALAPSEPVAREAAPAAPPTALAVATTPSAIAPAAASASASAAALTNPSASDSAPKRKKP